MCAFLCARDLNISSSSVAATGSYPTKPGAALFRKNAAMSGRRLFRTALRAANGPAFFFWHRGDLTMGSVVLILNTTVNIEIMAFLSAMELPNLFREIGVCQQALSF